MLLVAIVVPIANVFDHWDTSPGLSNDTEMQASSVGIVCTLCFTVGLACAACTGFKPPATRFHVELRPRVMLPICHIATVPTDTSQPPPLQLRI